MFIGKVNYITNGSQTKVCKTKVFGIDTIRQKNFDT